MPVRKVVRQRAHVGELQVVRTNESANPPVYNVYDAKRTTMESKVFTSPSGQESRWLLLESNTSPSWWYAISRDFFFSQKSAQSAFSKSGLEDDIRSFVNRSTVNFNQELYQDKLGEYWVLGQEDSVFRDASYALTGAYDGRIVSGGENVEAAKKPDDLKKAIDLWVVTYATGPIDPPSHLEGYNVGKPSATYGPPTLEQSQQYKAPTDATDKAILDAKTDAKAAPKTASPWQLPAGGAGGAGLESADKFAPMPEKKIAIPWTPIIVGSGAVLTIAYLLKQK